MAIQPHSAVVQLTNPQIIATVKDSVKKLCGVRFSGRDLTTR